MRGDVHCRMCGSLSHTTIVKDMPVCNSCLDDIHWLFEEKVEHRGVSGVFSADSESSRPRQASVRKRKFRDAVQLSFKTI